METITTMTEKSTIEETISPKKEKMVRAFALVTFSYLVALGAAIGIGFALNGLMHTLLITLIADVAATLVIYVFSLIFKNVSFYDLYWSVQPIAIAIYWMLISGATNANLARQIIVLSLVTIWGLRLTLNWARGWRGLKHEDWRYTKFRKENPKIFWLINLTGLQLMPTTVVFLGCLSLYPALVTSSNNFNFLDVIGIVITFGATLMETIADEQMKKFRKNVTEPEQLMSKGLWAISRHPNYFAEISFWWGLYFFALAADLSYWWTIAGPIVMVFLFLFISIPLMEKQQLKRRPDYALYKKKVSMLIPWFPKK